MCSEVTVNSLGNHVVSPEEEKERQQWEGFAEKKVLSLEWKSEGVMDDGSGELMELMEEVVPVHSVLVHIFVSYS